MSRQRSSNRVAAQKLWIKSGRQMKLIEIAAELGVSDSLIRKWKFLDKWDDIPLKRPRGAPKGNQNAKGNKGGDGAPEGNSHALKHGLYSKFLPQNKEFQELMSMIQELDPLDMLWQGVEIAFGKLIWAQRIMFVQDKDDKTIERVEEKNGNTWGEKWEVQQAWDKQFTDIKAYSAISREFRSAMKQFLAAAPENDERRTKLALMQAQVDKANAEVEKIKGGGKNSEAEDWVTALKQAAERRRAKVKKDG